MSVAAMWTSPLNVRFVNLGKVASLYKKLFRCSEDIRFQKANPFRQYGEIKVWRMYKLQ